MFNWIKEFFEKQKAKKEAHRYTVPSQPVDPKTAATANKEPWVAVLETHVNIENPRNGFFELDWNEYFIVMLRQNGYTGGSDEEVVDKWFQELCKEIGNDEGLPMDRRYGGYINVNNIGNGKSEIS